MTSECPNNEVQADDVDTIPNMSSAVSPLTILHTPQQETSFHSLSTWSDETFCSESSTSVDPHALSSGINSFVQQDLAQSTANLVASTPGFESCSLDAQSLNGFDWHMTGGMPLDQTSMTDAGLAPPVMASSTVQHWHGAPDLDHDCISPGWTVIQEN